MVTTIEPKLSEFGFQSREAVALANGAAGAPAPTPVDTRDDVHLQVGNTNTSMMIDMTISHPNAVTKTELPGPALPRSTSKVRKYQSNRKIETKGDGKLVIFGMESYGAFNKDAEETVQFVGGIKYPEAGLFATSGDAFRWRTLRGRDVSKQTRLKSTLVGGLYHTIYDAVEEYACGGTTSHDLKCICLLIPFTCCFARAPSTSRDYASKNCRC
jgi:hypothetical protein